MKRILRSLSLIAFFLTPYPGGVLHAEPIPLSFYASIEGLRDSILKSALHQLVSGGERYVYGPTKYHTTNNLPQWQKGDLKAYGTWQAFPLTDMTDSGTVWDMYSRCTRYYPLKQGESGCSLNIEHSFPKAWWGGDDNDAYKDLYHLNPSDARANQTGKNDYPPGEADSLVKFDNGSFKQGYMRGHPTHRVYEPADEYKGDFARAYFYMATAYEDYTWADKYSAYLNNHSYLEFQPWLIEVLLRWHRMDPVSKKEQHRQHVVSSIQHNRNPYIDYPDLVEYIWGNRKGESVHLAALPCYEETTYTPPSISTFSYCPKDLPDVRMDTIICLPYTSLTALKNQPGAEVNSGIMGNGTASVTMGKNTTDGQIVFTGLSLPQPAYLVLRASPFNTAESMQLDIYANDRLLESLVEIVVMETRHEKYYVVPVPAGTASLRLLSVGGSTKCRACLQQLYLLTPATLSSLSETQATTPQHAQLVMHQGSLCIRSSEGKFYTLQGVRIHN